MGHRLSATGVQESKRGGVGWPTIAESRNRGARLSTASAGTPTEDGRDYARRVSPRRWVIGRAKPQLTERKVHRRGGGGGSHGRSGLPRAPTFPPSTSHTWWHDQQGSQFSSDHQAHRDTRHDTCACAPAGLCEQHRPPVPCIAWRTYGRRVGSCAASHCTTSVAQMRHSTGLPMSDPRAGSPGSATSLQRFRTMRVSSGSSTPRQGAPSRSLFLTRPRSGASSIPVAATRPISSISSASSPSGAG